MYGALHTHMLKLAFPHIVKLMQVESLVIDDCDEHSVCYPVAVGLKDFMQVNQFCGQGVMCHVTPAQSC